MEISVDTEHGVDDGGCANEPWSNENPSEKRGVEEGGDEVGDEVVEAAAAEEKPDDGMEVEVLVVLDAVVAGAVLVEDGGWEVVVTLTLDSEELGLGVWGIELIKLEVLGIDSEQLWVVKYVDCNGVVTVWAVVDVKATSEVEASTDETGVSEEPVLFSEFVTAVE